MTLPTILFVPGACTAPSCYDLVVPLLKQQGYSTVQAPLPSNNPDYPAAHTAESDGLSFLNGYLLPLIKEGKEVIVFAHSFGATCMSGSKSNVSKSARKAKGEAGGVVGIIYISGCLAPDGVSQIEYTGGADTVPTFLKIDHPSPGLFVFDPVVPYLFNDTDPETAEELAKAHLPHAMQPLMTPVSAPLWTDPALDGRRAYFKTMRDKTFAPEVQQMFIEGSGVKWEVVEIDGGHEAFLTKPKLVADAVLKLAKSWQ
ncbi:hypothetical protein LTR10_005970 [Elasticomyces elasticus]|nr:hypothetical protein LTR10_005970 [Elasticomyces elasticus]KAK4965169.1 hypothetical protein LTR42_012591 [Elasticomyces elasticus]